MSDRDRAQGFSGYAMILRELEVSPAAEDPSAVPVGLSTALLQGIGAIVRSRTSSRFAALYPAAMRTIAINDGAHISTAPNPPLHQALLELLASQHCWLMFDTARHEGRVMSVSAAQRILCDQSAPPRTGNAKDEPADQD